MVASHLPFDGGSDLATLALEMGSYCLHTCTHSPEHWTIPTMGCKWSVQQWLEAYTCVLQCVREVVEGRHWRPEGEGFAPKVSPLVEAFISITSAWDAKNCALNCWSDIISPRSKR